jgi:hypothetical protein
MKSFDAPKKVKQCLWGRIDVLLKRAARAGSGVTFTPISPPCQDNDAAKHATFLLEALLHGAQSATIHDTTARALLNC